MSVLLDDNADIFVGSKTKIELISYYTFLSLILSTITMTSFYIISKRFILKPKGLSDARVASVTQKEYIFAVHSFC